MDQGKANGECRNRGKQSVDTCPVCLLRVLMHCTDCKIQVGGCLCTEVERFGKDEAWQRACDQFGEELARERYRRAGLWTPGDPL